MRRIARKVRALALAAVAAGLAAPALAADLRVDHAELARLVNAFAKEAKVVLNTVPGPIFGLAGTPSSVTVGSSTFPIPVPVNSFDVAGTRLVYYVSDINSTKVAASARPGAVRLTISFEETGSELTGDCISSFCPPDAVLPDVEWSGASVHADLVPTRVNGSVSLRATVVRIAGKLEPVCRPGSGFFSGISTAACRLALPRARAALTRVRADIETSLRDKFNSEPFQMAVADFLKRYLSIGQAGEVQISNIAVDTKGVLVSFRFAAN